MHKKTKTTSKILKSSIIVMALVFILALTVNSASAAVISVGNNSTGTDNATTIQGGINLAQANDTVVVHNKGTNWKESINIYGSSGKNGITVMAAPGESVTVTPLTTSTTIFNLASNAGTSVFIENVTIKGFNITGVTAQYAISLVNAKSCSILDNTIYNNLGGISLTNTDNITIQNNTISNPTANAARLGIISSLAVPNKNIKILNNDISNVGTGINIACPNFVITGNTIRTTGSAASQGYGMWVLPVYGDNSTNIISNNKITGTATNVNNIAGIWLTTSIVSVNPNTQIFGNDISNYRRGIVIGNITAGGSVYSLENGIGVTDVYLNRIVGNFEGIFLGLTTGTNNSGLINVTNNWFGKNTAPTYSNAATEPAAAGTNIYQYAGLGTIDRSTWMVLNTIANPTSILTGATSTITADLTKNNLGQDTTLLYPGKYVPNGITVTFTPDTLGTVNPTTNTTNNGIATTTFTAGSTPGTSTINAVVDSQAVGTTVNIRSPTANVGLTLTDNTTNHRTYPGSNVTFTVTAHNNGPDDAHNMVLTINFPTGIIYMSSPDGSFNSATKTLTWNVGTLAAGADAIKTFVAQFSNSKAGQDAALTVNEVQTELPGSATASDTVHVIGSVLSVTMTDNTVNHQANVGDMVTYTITVHNAGPDDATNVSVKDALNLGLNFISSPDGIYNSSSRAITWNVGTITAGSDFVTTFTAQVTSNFAGKNLNNTAQVKVDNLVKTSTSDVFYVKKAATTVTKTDNTVNHQARVGDLVTYTITVHNAGPDDATNVTLSDVLPTGLTFVSSPTGTYNAGTITWNIGTITSGSDAVVTFVAQVNSSTQAGKTVKNSVTGTQTEYGAKLSGSDSISIIA